MEESMKSITFAVAWVFAIVPSACAQYPDAPADRGDRYARVIDSTPVYAAAPREECFNPSTGSYEERRDQRADTRDDLDLSRCRVASESSPAVEGYDVRYRYAGNEYVARMRKDPGSRLVVGRDVNDDGTPF